MLSIPGGLLGLSITAQILVTVVALFFVRSLKESRINSRHVLWIGVLWVAFTTAEYWLLGAKSFIRINEDGDIVVPYLVYLAKFHEGGNFAHAFAGGVDLHSVLAAGNAYISLETGLFRALPIWQAVAAHKIMAVSLSFIGAYLLARRAGGAPRLAAVGLALSYSLIHRYMLMTSLGHGLGYAIIPLAVYFLVYRTDRRFYFLGAGFVAALNAISTTPLVASLAFGMACLIAWLFHRAKNPLRFMTGFGLVVVLAVANWHEVLFGLIQNAPLSSRAGQLMTVDLADLPYQLFVRFFSSRSPEAAIILVVSIAILAYRKSPELPRAVGIIVSAISIGPLILLFPFWKQIGLEFIQAFDFFYLSYALPVLLILVGGWSARALGPVERLSPAARLLAPGVLFVSIAMGQAAYVKVFHFAQWIGIGGQSVYVNMPNLEDRPWQTDELYRVATIPYRITANMMTMYGLEAFDGLTNILPRNQAEYWRYGVHDGSARGANSQYIIDHKHMDVLCCDSYDITQFVNLDALRVGNVSFIISVLPLYGGGLELVSGPPAGTVPPRRDQPMAQKLRGFLHYMMTPINAYVYRLPNSLPRAFAARAIKPKSGNSAVKDQYPGLVDEALALTAVIDEKTSGNFISTRNSYVRSIQRVPDGYDFEVSMPAGGTLVVNTPWTPFWRAVDGDTGAPVDVAPANGIHTAIGVPAGVKTIKFRYVRPTLKNKISEIFH